MPHTNECRKKKSPAFYAIMNRKQISPQIRCALHRNWLYTVQCTVDILQQEISANKKYSHFIDFYWIIIFVNNRPHTLHYSQQQKSHCLIHSYIKPFQTNCYQNIIKVLTKCPNYFCFRPDIYLQFFLSPYSILSCRVFRFFFLAGLITYEWKYYAYIHILLIKMIEIDHVSRRHQSNRFASQSMRIRRCCLGASISILLNKNSEKKNEL